MERPMNVRGGSSTRPIRQVAAVGIGAAVAFVGGFLGLLGALGAYMGCHHQCGASAWLVVVLGGLAILGTAPFVIARVASRERWLARGALGLGAGCVAFLLARGATALVGSDGPGWAVIVPSFGLAAAVALPAHDRWFVAARVAGVLALSMVPALVDDSGVLVRWVVRSFPDGSSMRGWEDHGGILIPLALLGVPAGLLLPHVLRVRRPPIRTTEAPREVPGQAGGSVRNRI